MRASGDSIERAWRAGCAALAGLAVERAGFEAFVERLGDGWTESEEERGVDIFLVCACLSRVPGAAETLVARYIDRIPLYLARRGLSRDLLADVQQQLAERLLFGHEGKPPLLASYTARGSLEGFVRVAASRLAVDLQRAGARQPRSAGAMIDSRALTEDLDLQLLKQSYREPFREAFAASAAALASEQRALLRLHYVDGLTTEQLARLRQVARATIIRRLADARSALVAGVQDRLRAKLGMAGGDFDSVLRLVRSQLDLSLVSLLRETLT